MKLKQIAFALMASAALMTFSACGSRSEGELVEDGPLGEFATKLQGNWWALCAPAHDISMTEQTSIYFKGESMHRTIELSFATKCKTWDVQAREHTKIFVGESIGDGAREMEMELKSMTVKPSTVMGSLFLNQLQWCGRTDWTVEQSIDVTNEVGKPNCFATRNKTYKSAFKMNGNDLMFGNMNVSAESNNWMNLNKDQVFKRPDAHGTPPPAPTPEAQPPTQPVPNE
jgi:hypothetical protein